MRYLLLLILSFFGLGSADTETVDLKIVVTNINTLKGTIEMGVFNNPKTFLKQGKEYKVYSQKVSSDSVIFLLKGYKKDDYAISLYHDVNSDNECNLNFFGIPVEPYGFSRNFRPKLSKPSFNDCKITAYQDMSVNISLID
jgi:uncharacterized protein (DUF2141 family)